MPLFTSSKKPSAPLYIDKELETYIDQSHQMHLSNQLGLAQHLASAPASAFSNPESLLGSLTSNYQNLIHRVDYYIAGDGHVAKAQTDVLDTKAEKEEVELRIKAQTERVGFLNAKLKEYLAVLSLKFKAWKRVKVMLWLMLALELLVNYKMFAVVGGSLLANLALAGLTCIAIFYYAEYIADYLRQFQSGLKKFIIALVSNMPVVLIFLLLAQLRINYLDAGQEGEHIDSGVIAYLLPLINCFVYSVCVNRIEKYKPTAQEKEAFQSYNIHKSELDQLQTKLQQDRTLLIELDKALRAKIQEHYSYLLLGRNKERQVVALYQNTFAQYKAELSLRVKHTEALSQLQTTTLPDLDLNYQSIQNPNQL